VLAHYGGKPLTGFAATWHNDGHREVGTRTDKEGWYALEANYSSPKQDTSRNLLVVCALGHRTWSLSLDKTKPAKLEISPTLESATSLIIHLALPSGLEASDFVARALRFSSQPRFATFRRTTAFPEPVAVFENFVFRATEQQPLSADVPILVDRKDGRLAGYKAVAVRVVGTQDGHVHYSLDLSDLVETALTLTDASGAPVAVPVIQVSVNNEGATNVPATSPGVFKFWSDKGELKITPTYMGVEFSPNSLTLPAGSTEARVVRLVE
jgi:hypothetical protein